MKLIAHRGNISGISEDENKPKYIENAISKGFDVEIDIRFIDGKLYLGHDEPNYEVNWFWLHRYKDQLWIHCKNLEALCEFSCTSGFNYFWHQEDDFTLTSKNYIWTYPGKPITVKSVIVVPEFKNVNFNCYGICSDFVELL